MVNRTSGATSVTLGRRFSCASKQWPVNLKLLDLVMCPACYVLYGVKYGYAPCCYVLYGVKYIGLVSLDATRPVNLKILTSRPFFSKWLASKTWIWDVFWYRIPAPWVLGPKHVPIRPRLWPIMHSITHHKSYMIGHSLGRMESRIKTRIKKFTPHCVCRLQKVDLICCTIQCVWC